MTNHDHYDDTQLTQDEERVVANLSVETISSIDEALIAKADYRFLKVARIVGDVTSSFPNIPESYFAQRIIKIVEAGRLESQGDLKKMRFSEVRLPSAPHPASYLDELATRQEYWSLGSLYESGQGVPKDYTIALEWYRMGADRGNTWSQLGVGRFYENSYGVEQDYVEAYFWYSLAASLSQSNPFPFSMRRDEIADKLSSEEKSEVQKRVSKWKSI